MGHILLGLLGRTVEVGGRFGPVMEIVAGIGHNANMKPAVISGLEALGSFDW
jgi:hypothetical protein